LAGDLRIGDFMATIHAVFAGHCSSSLRPPRPRHEQLADGIAGDSGFGIAHTKPVKPRFLELEVEWREGDVIDPPAAAHAGNRGAACG